MKEYAITTEDNPINPFDDPFMWWFYDELVLGYGTSQVLGRLALTSGKLSDAENNEAIGDAIDSIILMHGGHLYKKLTRDVDDAEYLELYGIKEAAN